MRARLIAVLVVLALVLGGAILLANAGGGGDDPLTQPPASTAGPTTAPPVTATDPPPASTAEPSTTTTTRPPTTTAATTTTAPSPEPPVGCLLIDDSLGLLLVLEPGAEERNLGPIRDSETGEAPRGGGPGSASQLEALAHQPGTGRYFATSWGVLGTLDPRTAIFSEVGATGLPDVDGLAFDEDGALYGVARVVGAADRLVEIDPSSGRAVVIGPIAGPGVLEDADDLAFEPGSGELFAVTNRAGEIERTSVLVTVDPANGRAAAVGTDLGVADAEGLTFQSDGRLWVTTGQRGGSALFLADPSTGTAEGVALLGNGVGDYEAIACPNGEG